MGCSCHGSDGRSVKKSNPYDQCTLCARKHIKSAWSKWGEFTYEDDNRDYVSAQLRDAADHLKYDHPQTALKCRELAMVIEENKDSNRNIAQELEDLKTESRGLFYQEHPEARKRLDELKSIHAETKIDENEIIVLSKEDNEKIDSLIEEKKNLQKAIEKSNEISSRSNRMIGAVNNDFPNIPNANPENVKTVPIPNFTSDMDGGVMPLSMDTEKEESTSSLETVFLGPSFNMMGQPIDRGTDIIIPLGPGSKSNNDELKILLRSIERNCTGIKRIILATRHVPEWLNKSKFTIVPLDDPEEHLKDANLIYKTLEVIKRCRVQSFVWCADDNVFMKEVKLNEIPRLHNPRGRNAFNSERKWCRRVINTFDYFKQLGIDIDYNFETHTPQYFRDAQGLLKAMEEVDYREQPGLTIMTAFYCSLKDVDKGLPQQDYKETFELAESVSNAKFDKMYVGYNDKAFIDGGLRERLFKVFKDKSKYEL